MTSLIIAKVTLLIMANIHCIYNHYYVKYLMGRYLIEEAAQMAASSASLAMGLD